MKKIILLLILGGIIFSPFVVTHASANTSFESCGNHNRHTQNGINNNANTSCNNNSNFQFQNQTQNNNKNVNISLANVPTVVHAPITTTLPSTGSSSLVHCFFRLPLLGLVFGNFA